METPEKGLPPLKRKQQRENRLTVIIMGKLGKKVRSFEISRRVIFWATLFLIVYIPASIIVINRYIDLRAIHLIETQRANHLQEQVTESKKRLFVSRERIAFLEKYIQSIENQKQTKKSAGESKQEVARVKAVAPSPAVSYKAPKQAETKQEPGPIVSIDDMVIKKEGSTVEVDFRLVNLKGGDNAVGGYIHIIGKSAEPDASMLWTFPHEKLVEGVPENYRRGQLFLIQRFKPVKGRLGPVSDTQFPSSVHVLVYDQSGNLLLRQKFEVPHDS